MSNKKLVDVMLSHFETCESSEPMSKFQFELREAIYQLISALPEQDRPQNLPLVFQCA